MRLVNIREFWVEDWCDLIYILMRFNKEGGSKEAIYETVSPTQLRDHGGLSHGHNNDSCSMGTVQKEKQYRLLMDQCRLQKSQE